jgi:transcription elongation GreA/GreB family factor
MGRVYPVSSRSATIEVTTATEQKREQDENDNPSGCRHRKPPSVRKSNRHARRYSPSVSKAFTKDDDGVPPPPLQKRGIPVPDPNYLTPAGARSARAELEQLTRTGGDPDRIRELGDHLATAQIVGPDDLDTVGFGARVTVEDADGERTTYQVVGAIEADPKRGLLSWQTPVANVLWGARIGDSVVLPRGVEVEIVELDYPGT